MAENLFSGSYAHSLDAKGRVTIPAAYREALGSSFTLGMNHQMNALALYPKEEWAEIADRLGRIPLTDARGMAYVRLINAHSYPQQELDGQGRVILPSPLRQKAGIGKEIVFVGTGRLLELWDARRFEAFCAATEAELTDVMDYVNERYFS